MKKTSSYKYVKTLIKISKEQIITASEILPSFKVFNIPNFSVTLLNAFRNKEDENKNKYKW